MPVIDAVVECQVADSFRVQQVAGLFDLKIPELASERFRAEIPGDNEPWEIGLIVGPSGSGKSTIAREAYGDRLVQVSKWPKDKAIVDCFGERPIKDVTALLTAVGFSSPPSWIKPYRVLSNGERFRCDIARALCQEGVVAFDEFTSVVDRQVAKIGSAAIAKAIRSKAINCRFVAVTCHYDVAEWLEPDWVADMATGETRRGLLRRPAIQLEIFPCAREAWRMFGKHHYLNTENVPAFARCYLGCVNGEPAGFVSVISNPTRRQNKGRWRVSRIVVLPDYQGIGIGGRLLNAVAGIEAAKGHTVSISTTHPAMIGFLKRSPDWLVARLYKQGGAPHKIWDCKAGRKGVGGDSTGRAMVSAEYRGLEDAQPSEHLELPHRPDLAQHPGEMLCAAGETSGGAVR